MPAVKLAAELIKERQSFLIITHTEPDGDALGSALALRYALRKLGKEADAVCIDKPSPVFNFLPGVEDLAKDFLLGDYDAVIIVDCGDLSRTGFPARLMTARNLPIINIDHHPRNDSHKVAAVNLVDSGAAASAQIVAELIDELAVPLDPTTATLLLTGIFTDTGGFRHGNTTSSVLKLAAKLLNYGARLRKIARLVRPTRSLTTLRLWGIGLSRIRKHPSLPLAVSLVRIQDLKNCQAVPDDLNGLVNIINAVPGARAGVMITELPDGLKVSLRSETDVVDVGRLASLLGGGGHRKSAGFRINGWLSHGENGWQIITEDRKRRTEDGKKENPSPVTRLSSDSAQVAEWQTQRT